MAMMFACTPMEEASSPSFKHAFSCPEWRKTLESIKKYSCVIPVNSIKFELPRTGSADAREMACPVGASGQQFARMAEIEQMDEIAKSSLVGLTANIVSAYVSNNTVGREDIPAMIADIHEALSKASQRNSTAEREDLKPAVSPKKSVHDDYLICLEDGKKFKSLKRHLRTHYNLSPDEYREKWGLPHDYPMVAPNYAAARSHLAKQMGLGTRREK
jgi:predicted transcriptional regulator